MEFGPRALGNRSILTDPRSNNMQDFINSKVKFREAFRPFAPSVLLEKAGEYFAIKCESSYMQFVAAVKKRFPAITGNRSCALPMTPIDASWVRISTIWP